MRVAHSQVWSVTLDPTVAIEQHGTHPCVVVSIDRFNALPIQAGHRGPVDNPGSRVPAPHRGRRRWWAELVELAMCEAVRAVSLERFGQLIGTADSVTITSQLARWLGHPS